MEAQASSMTIALDTAFGNYEPEQDGYKGTYGTVVFEEISDINGDSVKITINSGADLGSTPDLHKFYFNTTSDLRLLSDIGQEGNNGLRIATTTPTADLYYSFATEDKAFRADGDGYFDGVIDFGSGGDKLSKATFTIRSENSDGSFNDLYISNFMDGSFGGPKGSFTVATHWQNTDTPAGSEWVGGNPNPVPIPAPFWVLGIGLLGIRRFMK